MLPRRGKREGVAPAGPDDPYSAGASPFSRFHATWHRLRISLLLTLFGECIKCSDELGGGYHPKQP